ncbi:MAG: hypothetical protein AAF488_04400 [Planctomycetota bacterium]
MSQSTPLTLVFHIVDGRQLRYEQPDPARAAEIIRDVKRRRIFDQPLLSICGNSSVTGLATRSIVKIDFLNAGELEWPKMGSIDRMVRVSQREFDHEARQSPERQRPHEVGELTVNHVRVDFLGDDTDYFEIYSKLGSAMDERRTLQHFYGANCLYAEYPGVGTTLYNTNAIERITLIPGPPEAPDGAWLAHHLVESEVPTPTE